MEFRDVWLGAVQNARLQDTIRRFTDHAQQVRLGTLSDPGTQKIVVDGMRALLEGFLERDPRKIKTAMLAFIVSAEQQYLRCWADTTEGPRAVRSAHEAAANRRVRNGRECRPFASAARAMRKRLWISDVLWISGICG